MTEENSYNTLQENTGIKYVRDRAYIYMGSTSSVDGNNAYAQVQMFQEAISNAFDEAVSGYGNLITAIVHEDNSVTVEDHGRGLPKDMIRINKKTGEKEIVPFGSAIGAFTKIGVGGKFSNKNYGLGSTGLNAAGLKGIFALSKYVDAEVQTANHEHYHLKLDYDKFEKEEEPEITEELPFDESKGTYTNITFLPDTRVLDNTSWQRKELEKRFETSAYLTPKVKCILIDEREIDDETKEPWKKEWYSENGLIDYVKTLSEGQKILKGFKEPISFDETFDIDDEDNKIIVKGALQWTDTVGMEIVSFANGAPTIEGGYHQEGALQGITKAINDYVSEKNLLGRKGHLDPSDMREGLFMTMNVMIPEKYLQFESQTKRSLGTGEAKVPSKNAVANALTRWLYDHEKEAKLLIDKMNESKQARENAIKARKEAKAARDQKKKSKGKLIVSSKLTVAAPNTKPEDREILICEGNSAAGSLIQARTPNQAVFPLRGKILNTLELNLTRVLKNEEISTITSVLGAGIGPAFDINDLQYDKIIILTDADDDGMHIRSLCITLFYKFFKPLIDAGHLYVAEAPLFRINRYDKKTGKPINEYTFNVKDKDALIKEWKSQGIKEQDINITRFKGLGENNPSDLKRAVINPETRHLIRITAKDVEAADRYLMMCMGNNPGLRHEWVQENLKIKKEEI